MGRSSVLLTATVTAAGTAVQLTTESHSVVSLLIYAGRATAVNTGAVCLGDSTVDKATARGVVLTAGSSWDCHIDPNDPWEINTIYVDADTTGDQVQCIYRLL